jgi:hypothetical protein
MAGLTGIAQTVEIATGTAVKTLLQLVAPTNQRLLVKEISISFKGITSTDAPILVDLLRQTTAGTMSALTINPDDAGYDEALQATAQHTATAEPTAGVILYSEEVHPQGGAFLWQAPYKAERICKGGTRLGLRVTAGVSVSALARMVYEE